MQWETVVGFEVHCELLTKTKLFSGCPNEFGKAPNTQVDAVSLGLPGSLPVMNAAAVDLSMRASLALNCKITRRCDWERKNYYYPDLPKNYQISQLRRNLGVDGWLEFPVGETTKRVRINNVHLEEDAGKNIHPEEAGADYSLVDLNRAGVPLLEIVTEPDLRSMAECEAFMEAMRQLLEYTGVSDCNMHEGRLRFEANISVRPKGSEEFGTKVEIKNIASTKTVLKCVEYETERQSELLEDGGTVLQETRLWDEAAQMTRSMRSKEVANDYRYFPDPDLVEVEIDDAWLARVQNELPELPQARRERFITALGLSEYDAELLTARKAVADYFEAGLAAHDNAKGLANWISAEMLRWLNEDAEREVADYPVAATALAGLVKLIDEGTINGKIAKQVYPKLAAGEGSAAEIVEREGLKQVTDTGSIEPIIDEVMAKNPQIVEDLRGGKMKAIGALVGQVMKASRGKANPQMVNEIIMKKIQN